MKPAKGRRPKLPSISEEMKAWSAALAGEIAGWPQVSMRSFFGFTALYRKDRIFALLPRSRAIGTPNSLALKLDTPGSTVLARLEPDPRLGPTRMQRARWFTFEISSDSDLHDALDWLSRAHDGARKARQPH